MKQIFSLLLLRIRNFCDLTYGSLLFKCFRVLLALLVLLMQVDLGPLEKQEAWINPSLSVEYKKNRPSLPSNMRYEDQIDLSSGLPFLREPRSDNGYSIIYEYTKEHWLSGFVDETEKVVIKPTFGNVGHFHEGAAAASPDKGDFSLTGFIDHSGKWLLPPKYDEAGPFRKGLAPVIFEKRAGFIDHSGKFTAIKTPAVLSLKSKGERASQQDHPKISLPEYMGKNYLASCNDKQGMVDTTGNWLIQPIYKFDQFDDTGRCFDSTMILATEQSTEATSQFFKIGRNSKWGIANLDGKIILAPLFDEVVSFNKGHAAVKIDGRYGFVDTTGAITIQPKYDDVTAFDDLIGVKSKRKWNLVDSTGRAIQADKFDEIVYEVGARWYCNGLGAVTKNGKCGFINSRGKLAIPFTYTFVRPFDQGSAPVWDGAYWQFIDAKGRLASPLRFGLISSFVDGSQRVFMPGPLFRFAWALSIERQNKIFEGQLTDGKFCNPGLH